MEATLEPEFDVFITYSHLDVSVASAVDVALRVAGARVFLDVRDIRPGDRMIETVFGALANTRMQLVLLGPNARLPRFGFGRNSMQAVIDQSIRNCGLCRS